MPTEQPPGAGGISLRARTLIHRDDERITAVATQLRPELPKGSSPDHAHYLAAVAVAVLDARTELKNRDRGTGQAVTMALIVTVAAAMAAAVAGAIALWQVVLS